jgi:hypothetical protein
MAENLPTVSIQIVALSPGPGWNGLQPEIKAVSGRKIGEE